MKKRILIIEDEEAVATYLSTLLERAGFTVEIAGSVEEGLAQTESDDFELVILDLTLPDGTGCDFLRQLKERKTLPRVLVVTGARQDDPKVSESLKLGALGCVTKNSSVSSLLEAVRRAMGE